MNLVLYALRVVVTVHIATATPIPSSTLQSSAPQPATSKTSFTLDVAKNIATILGAIIATLTLGKGAIEYVQQGAQKRAESFFEMRKRLKDNPIYRDILSMVDLRDPAVQATSFKDRRDLLGFFEEVALLVNSRVIRREVAHYMFGYYAIRVWENDDFWHGVNRASPYWALFRHFAEDMQAIERNFVFENKKYHF